LCTDRVPFVHGSAARENTLHCKLDPQLSLAAVRSIFWVGGDAKMEIPVNIVEEIEDLGTELSVLTEPNPIMDALANRMVRRFGMAMAAVWMIDKCGDKSGTNMELRATAGNIDLPHDLGKVPAPNSLLGRAIAERQSHILSPKHEDEELAQWARKHGLKFVAAYPLSHAAEVEGVLLMAGSETPAEDRLALFRVYARLVSAALGDCELLALRHFNNKLSILVEDSKALSATLDLCELLGRILDVAKAQVGAERGTLFMVDDKTEEIWSLIAHGLEKEEIRLPLRRGISGHVAATGEIVSIPDAYADPRFNPDVDKRTGYRTRNLLCLPIRNKAGKIIAALELLNKKVGHFTNEDSEFLLTLAGHIAVALENAQLHQVLIEQERMEKELALAREIQRGLLPETVPEVEGFDFALINEPCFAVGGDYYDFLDLDAHTMLVVIADVEGKGVSSALVMSNLQATLRVLVHHLHGLTQIAESLNQMIWKDTRAEKYLSLFMGLIDFRCKAIYYVNCGHVPPVIVRREEDPISLTQGGKVIGLFEHVPYERGMEQLLPGDLLVLCTDGITESSDAEHDEYGAERLIECVRANADQNSAGIVEAVRTDVTRYSRHGTHVDDKVLIVIKVN
jgi:serine phosphatase RsbU (regulator of sigma subunit)